MSKNKFKNSSKKTNLNEIQEMEDEKNSQPSNKDSNNNKTSPKIDNNKNVEKEKIINENKAINQLDTEKSEDSENKVKESQKIKAEKYKSNNIIEEVVGEEEDHSLLKTNNNSMINNLAEKEKVSNNNIKSNNSSSKEIDQQNKPNLNLNNDFTIEFDKNLEHRNLLDKTKLLNTSGTKFETYLLNNLIPNAFNKIFAELITKNVKSEDFFAYTAARLNEIGKEYEDLKNNYHFENIT